MAEDLFGLGELKLASIDNHNLTDSVVQIAQQLMKLENKQKIVTFLSCLLQEVSSELNQKQISEIVDKA